MFTLPRVIGLLRLVFVALFLLLVMLETFSLPGAFLYNVRKSPDRLWQELPITALAISWAVCLQIALVMAWRLLTLVKSDRIFTEDALRPMQVILRVAGYVAVTLALLWLILAVQADDPGGMVVFLLVLLCVTVAWLMIYVLREVLRRAIAAVTAA